MEDNEIRQSVCVRVCVCVASLLSRGAVSLLEAWTDQMPDTAHSQGNQETHTHTHTQTQVGQHPLYHQKKAQNCYCKRRRKSNKAKPELLQGGAHRLPSISFLSGVPRPLVLQNKLKTTTVPIFVWWREKLKPFKYQRADAWAATCVSRSQKPPTGIPQLVPP